MRHVKANGVEIACEITGSGPPIVLCHGGQSDHRNFYNFAPILAETLTVIAYDRRGTGDTRNGVEPYTVKDHGRDVCALIEALGHDRAHVFGTSFGGLIAQEAVLHCPERIDRLMLSATWPGGEKATTDEFYQLAMSVKSPEQTRAYWQMFFSIEFARDFPEEIEKRMQRVISTRAPARPPQPGQNVPIGDSRDRLPSVRNPTLVLSGAGDRIVAPETSRRLADLIPNSRFVSLEGVGHATTLQAPERVADEVLRFIGAA